MSAADRSEANAYKKRRAKDNASFANEKRSSDALRLNVSGTKIDVTRRTLTIIDGSKLAAKFSGNWDESLAMARDADGNIFIDQKPTSFLTLIEYLQHKANEGSDSPAVDAPKFDTNKDNQDFYRMICYYGMKGDIYPVSLSRDAKCVVPMHCHPNVQFRCMPNSQVYLVPTDDRFYIRSIKIAFPLQNEKDYRTALDGQIVPISFRLCRG